MTHEQYSNQLHDIELQKNCITVTIYEQYNNHSHKIELQKTVLQWRYMKDIITTHITLSYIKLYHSDENWTI